MALTIYNQELGKLEIELKKLPPKAHAERILATPKSTVSILGRANAPFGLIEHFSERMAEISREDLPDPDIARLFMAQRRMIEAALLLEKPAEEGDPRARVLLGCVEAEVNITRAVQLLRDIDDTDAKLVLGRIHEQMAPMDALEYFKAAEKVASKENNPAQGIMNIYIGSLFATHGHLKKAIPYFKAALPFGDYSAYMDLARIAQEQEDMATCRKWLEEGSAQNYGPARAELANLLIAEGKTAEGKALIESLIKLGYTVHENT